MRFAIIGCGPEGLAYAAAARTLGFEVAACADRSLAAARKAAALARASAKKESAAVLKQTSIAAVVLGGPPAGRAALAAQALSHGKHVLCPPPLAPDAAKSLLAAARAGGVHLYIAYENRVAPEDLALAHQLEAGGAGRPGFVRVHRAVRGNGPAASRDARRRAPGEAILTGLLARDVDALVRRHGLPAAVFAQAAAQPGVDHAAVTLTFSRGPIAQLIGTRADHGLPDRAAVEVCGDGGMIHYTTDDPVLESTGRDGRAERSSPIAPDGAARHLLAFTALLAKAPARQQNEHDLNVVRVIEAALRSARSGREQRP